jgi:hypothetical protein
MATVYNYEAQVTKTAINGIKMLSATNVLKVSFNNPKVALTTNVFSTASFIDTTGLSKTSGSGTIVFDNAHHKNTINVHLADRTSFSAVLLSATVTTQVALTSAGFSSWGPSERRLRSLGYF